MPLDQSKRTIDYTQTLTYFPNTVTSTLVLVFFTGNKLISSPQINNKNELFHFNQYNYSILSDNAINVTPCSIAACESIIGHHDFPTNPPEALFNCKIGHYHCADSSIIAHGYRLAKCPSEFDVQEPVGSPNHHDNYSLASRDVNDSAWDTNPNKNPYYPVHFDRLGNSDNPCTTTYNAADTDYHDDSDD